MPRLDLLPEQHLHLVGVPLADQRQHSVVECFEHLGGVGTYVVEVDLEGVEGGGGGGLGGGGVSLAGKFWGECHVVVFLEWFGVFKRY